MKKIVALVLALSMVFALCACGKSETVKAAENAIDEIGEVTENSEAAIINAEKIYNNLTDNEKEQVSNRMELFNARESFDSLWLDLLCSNKWRLVLSDTTITFDKTGTVKSGSDSGTWVRTDNTIVLSLSGYYSDYNNTYTFDNSDGIPKLIYVDSPEYTVYTTEEHWDKLSEEFRVKMEAEAIDLDWKAVGNLYLNNPESAKEQYNGKVVRFTGTVYNLSSYGFDMAIETYGGYPLNAISIYSTADERKNVSNYNEITVIGVLHLSSFHSIDHAFVVK